MWFKNKLTKKDQTWTEITKILEWLTKVMGIKR